MPKSIDSPDELTKVAFKSDVTFPNSNLLSTAYEPAAGFIIAQDPRAYLPNSKICSKVIGFDSLFPIAS